MMLYAGTSGFAFKEWVGPFYPPRTPASKYLSFYASRLSTVEINYTFRRFPTERLLSSWAAQTPPGFKFSLKMHQSITHVARLKNVAGLVRDFSNLLKPLESHLGVILFQLPPYLQADLHRLERVLADLPGNRRFAFEFRHPSWLIRETADLLRGVHVAVCRGELPMPRELLSPTAPYAYIRLRKPPPFSAAELSVLRRGIEETLTETGEVYLYVKHDPHGAAPQIALEMQKAFVG